jgi:hypothetical protein
MHCRKYDEIGPQLIADGFEIEIAVDNTNLAVVSKRVNPLVDHICENWSCGRIELRQHA